MIQSHYKEITQFKEINNQPIHNKTKNKKIKIEWNCPEIYIQNHQKPIGKYKKVGK